MLTNSKEAALKGMILAVMAAILWGVSGIAGQFLFQHRGVSVSWLITARMLISGFILLLFASFGKEKDLWKIWSVRTDAIKLIIFSIAGMLAVQYTYFAAVSLSNAATATVLQYAGPVIIAAYLALRNKKMPRPLEILAILLAVTGTFLLVTHGRSGTLAISPAALFMGLASAVALAVYTLQPLSLLARYSSVTIIGWGMFLGGLPMCFFNIPWQADGVWDSYSFIAFSFIVIFGTLVAFYSYITAVKIIGGQKASLLASAEPLSATLIAVGFLGTPFLFMDWLGSCCILSTIFLLAYKKRSGNIDEG